MKLTPAERLLQSLGVTEPQEIDVEAIAYHLGALIKYHPLDGCDARIVGVGDRAIIAVNARSSPQRQRFSIAHELGHWRNDRGKSLVCRVDDYRPDHRLSTERIADRYASDLLMPHYLFGPAVKKLSKLTVKAVGTLAADFETSLTATAIRTVESDHWPAMLVCHSQFGRKWFTRAPMVPSRWFPRESLDADSLALDVLFGRKPGNSHPRRIGAEAWFDRHEAEKYEVLEESVRISSTEVLTIITFTDTEMLEEAA